MIAQSGRLGIPVVPIQGTKHAARVEENARAVDTELSTAALGSLDALTDDVVGRDTKASAPRPVTIKKISLSSPCFIGERKDCGVPP